MTFLDIAGERIEYQRIGNAAAAAAPLVFLHEGLGSVAMWQDFPARLAAATQSPAIVYSRPGYGRSAPRLAPLGVDYMQHEALDILPAVLDALGLEAPILIGHSDGASIALIAAAAAPALSGLILEAPHVFVEDLSIQGIQAARAAYETGDLKARLARYHDDVEGVFRGWNDIWLSPAFRDWTIEEGLAAVRCPVLLIQGRDDPYGSLAQLDKIERAVAGPCERLVLDHCAHTPHREQAAKTLAAMARFIATRRRSVA